MNHYPAQKIEGGNHQKGGQRDDEGSGENLVDAAINDIGEFHFGTVLADVFPDSIKDDDRVV